MKPILLHLHNVGPYLDEKLDFSALEDMFLIGGKTGSGKTTIFDAMTYALYGKPSGSRASENVRIRSDFAPENEKAFIEFTFMLNERKFRINREVVEKKFTESGKVKNSKKDISFEESDDKTGEWRAFQGTQTEINGKIQSLIGLSREEFAQIVLLPQGEFAKFLNEKSIDRQKTLAKLFPVERFSAIARTVKAKADEAESRINAKLAELDGAKRDFDAEAAEKSIAEAEKRLNENAEAVKERANTLEEKSARRQKLLSEAEEIKTAENLRKKLDALLEKTDFIAADKERIKKADAAFRLQETLHIRDGVKMRLMQKTSAQANTLQEHERILQKSAELDAETQAHAARKTRIQELSNEIYEADKKLERAKKAAGFEAAYRENLQTLLNAFGAAKTLRAELQNQNEGIEKEIFANSELISDAEQSAEDLRAAKELEKTKDMAGTLAAHLKENMPCPVCGSREHPKIAPLFHSVKDFDVLIEKNMRAAELAKTENKRLEEKKSVILQKISAVSQIAVQIEETAAAQCISLPENAASTAGTTAKINIEDLRKNASGAETAIIQAKANMESLSEEGGGDAAFIADEKEILQTEKRRLDSECAAFEKAVNAAKNALTAAETTLKNLAAEITALKEEEAEAEAKVSEDLRASVFETEEELQSAVMNRTDFDAITAAVRQYEIELSETRAKLSSIKTKKIDSSAIRDELISLQEEIDGCRADIERINADNAALSAQKTKLTEQKERAVRLEREYKTLREENEVLLRLNRDISGANPQRKPLDSWVLGAYLEEVVRSANIRFARISAGRYRFILKEDATGRGYQGLELTVHDSHTGRERTTETLSGGETFEASLSLALALTDAVQSISGGIRLDSLFIDEGFGTLDGEALDNAIAILDEVREHRMVGIISHVEALHGAIRSHVEIEKSNTVSKIVIR